MGTMKYPDARRDESVVDTLHGCKVPDPYRWLEDPDSEETSAWVTKQNELFDNYIDDASETKDRCLERLKQINEFDKISCPFRRGKFIYFYKKQGLQNHHILYQLPMREDAPPTAVEYESASVFLDPNTFSEDGTSSLGQIKFSKDGKWLAYGVNTSGSDWATIRVMNVESRETNEKEDLEWAKFYSIAWNQDGSGFYYCRYPEPESLKSRNDVAEKRGAETEELVNHAVYYHTRGTTQEKDRLVLSTPEDPKWMFSPRTTTDGNYLVVEVSQSCEPRNKLFVVDITKHFGDEQAHFVRYIDTFELGSFQVITNNGPEFYLETNYGAPKNCVISVNIDEAWDAGAITHVVREHETDVLANVIAVNNDHLITIYEHDVKHILQVRTLSTGELVQQLTLPDVGCVSECAARREDAFFFFKFTSFVYAGMVFQVDFAKSKPLAPVLLADMKVPDFEPSLFETVQVFCTSKDGTRIPIFLVRRRGPDTGGSEKPPCILYGYGGFMISITPAFSLTWALWLQHFGGVVAVANIRGGSEYGEEWHNAGIVDKKQNVFDDFQAAAEYLVDDEGVTSRKRLCIMGGSNGGTLVGACVNQRPDLYGAGVAKVGVMDMLRFHKFTIGSAWVSDFGDPDDADHFPHILRYSPLHNIFNPDERASGYPAVLLTTASHDDRVVPLHSFKFAAELQHKAGSSAKQTAPLLIRVHVKTGHGGGKPTMKALEETAEMFAFIRRALYCPFIE